MSWTDLFKSKKPPAHTPDPTVRWFGKLPTYADYYASNADEAWAVEFNDWILKGYEIYLNRHRTGTTRSRRLPLSRCVIRLPKSEMTVLASVQDYGGDMRGRPFPLCFYVGVPTAQWPGPTSDRVLAVAGVLNNLTALQRDVIRFCNAPSRFESMFESREVDLASLDPEFRDDSWVRRAGAVSLSDWFSATQPGLSGRSLDDWASLATQYGGKISKLESESFEVTLAFPLAAGIPWEAQQAGWLRWLESRMDLERRALSLIVTGELNNAAMSNREPGRLVVIARKMVNKEDFLLLTSLAGSLPYLDDLSAAKTTDGPDDGGKEADSTADQDPPRTGASWGEFVAGAASVS